jgi:hypothetical protein
VEPNLTMQMQICPVHHGPQLENEDIEEDDALSFRRAIASPEAPLEDLRLELQRRGIPQIQGPIPKSPYAIKARIGVLQKRIKEFDRARGAVP